MTVAESWWDAASHLLITRLQGNPTVEDVRRWRESLMRELAHIEDGSQFMLLVDLFGFEPVDLAAHKEMRTVIPLTLADYGMRTALLDLFEGVELPVKTTRGIRCIAVAHVHHDRAKMEEYDRRLGRDTERWFASFEQAKAWITKLSQHQRPENLVS